MKDLRELLALWKRRAKTSHHAHAWSDAVDELEEVLAGLHVEMDDDAEIVNGHHVPDGTLLLEPREYYDKALIGAAHQGGMVYAVYSRSKTLEVMHEFMAEEDVDEMYDFNTSGSIGVRFPVFLLDDEPYDGGQDVP